MKYSELLTESGHTADRVSIFRMESSDDVRQQLAHNGKLIQYVVDPVEADFLAAVKNDGFAIQYYAAPSEACCLDALENTSGRAFPMIERAQRTDAVIDKAVELDGTNLRYLTQEQRTHDRMVAAVEQDPKSIIYCTNLNAFDPEESQSAQAAAVQPDPHSGY